MTMATCSRAGDHSSQTEINLFGDLFDEDDESYQEVEDVEAVTVQVNDDPSVAPSYLLTAILGGLYELPPIHILRYQTGWGRRVRYDPEKLVRLKPDFHPIGTLLTIDSTTLVLEEMTLRRYTYAEKQQFSCMQFCIYRVQVQSPEKLNQALKDAALEEQRNNPNGMDVSNAGGGWHGRPRFFQHERRLYRVCVDVIQEIEKRQTRPTRLQLEPQDIECWVNISKNGSWNRLHTHEGSVWSGVYYVDDGNSPPTHYGGRMLLKPTAHPKEDTYTLSTLEKVRFTHHSSESSMDVSGSEYLEIDPVPGHMIVFPGWLHHCVLPLSHLDCSSLRISVAFNVNGEHESTR
jgi:uncharacterized protein (TIGR02466 family)